MKLRKQTIREDDCVSPKPSLEVPDIRNVVVFGESGVGKSSLINLIAGKRVCETSSGALGCTLEYKQYLLDLGAHRYAVWDTAGLDEGTEGSIPPDKAEAYLKQLLHELTKNNGVDLLVYCVRGTRVRSALITNYHVFYSAICRKKVPIAIVITGLENQEDNMETWWDKNGFQFSLLKMDFDGHACVTTLESSVENPFLQERREVSKVAVAELIANTCRTHQWKPPERSWVESAYSDIRAMFAPRDGYSARPTTIIMCETFRDPPISRLTRKRSISFQNPVAFSFSLPPLSFRSPVLFSNDSSRNKLPFEDSIKCISERQYHVYQVSPQPLLPSEGMDENRQVTVVKRGADLLIFCARMEEPRSGTVRFQWEHFISTYGGDLSPQIVVVIGVESQSTAEEWWMDTVGGTPERNDLEIAYWPTDAAGTEVHDAARARLQWLINNRCIDCNRVAPATRNEKLFRHPLSLDMSNLISSRVKLERRGDARIEQDVLTKLGVWYSDPNSELGSPGALSPTSPMEFALADYALF